MVTSAGNIAQNPTPVFGGQTAVFNPAQVYSQKGPAVKSIAIAGFDYHPGGLGQAPVSAKPGQTVTFTNLDADVPVYHTVTSCGVFSVHSIPSDACNLDYGQAYPLATWPSTQGGFDSSQTGSGQGSGELGYGPPTFTAAANYGSWSFKVPATAAAGTVYPFYCRIHPFMRGSLKVVP